MLIQLRHCRTTDRIQALAPQLGRTCGNPRKLVLLNSPIYNIEMLHPTLEREVKNRLPYEMRRLHLAFIPTLKKDKGLKPSEVVSSRMVAYSLPSSRRSCVARQRTENRR